MIPNSTTRDDRETLSALLDGELQGDAARFATKRLDHDEDWRATLGRWQLAGDVLRGHPVAAAPGLAARVRAEIADTSPGSSAPAVAASPGAVRWRRGVAGVALAATVAAVAVVGVRGPADVPSASAIVGARAPTPPAAPAVTTPVPPLPMGVAPAPAAVAPDPRATPPVAVAAAPRTRAHASRRAAQAQAQAQAEQVQVASATPAADPFRPQPFAADGGEPVARPWPRAALPALSGADMRASDQRDDAGAPSYYPFEPRLPAAQDAPER